MFKKTFVKYLCVFISLPLNGMEINNLIINTNAKKGYKTTKFFHPQSLQQDYHKNA